ncbi:trimethylamine monooxygenase-like [Clytia hemisphaerica]|uniref:trimethylamine monooxygenase-like n=1 Tax=Clytia hemisphaerica TaxID=252671 RepID=UPI0034D7766D
MVPKPHKLTRKRIAIIGCGPSGMSMLITLVKAKQNGDQIPDIDYTFDEHFKKPISSYPPRHLIHDYILGRARKYDIERFVKFSTFVKQVIKNENGVGFSITYEHLPTRTSSQEYFDYVIVASGLYTTAFFPVYPGIETFPGRVIHSKDFRRNEELIQVQKLLIVGTSFSAMDIAQFHQKVNSNCTHLSILPKRRAFNRIS